MSSVLSETPPPSNLRLGARIPVTRGQYEQIQADLLELLEARERPLADRLIAQSLYLRLLEDFVRQAHKEGLAAGAEDEADAASADPSSIAGSRGAFSGAALDGILPPLPISSELLRIFREQIRVGPWRLLFAMAAKPLERPVVLRAFLGTLVSLRQRGEWRRGRLAQSFFLAYQFTRHAMRLGGVAPGPGEAPVNWRALRRVAADFSAPHASGAAFAQIRDAIVNGELARTGDLRLGDGILLARFALWRLCAASLALRRGADTVAAEDIEEALRRVEGAYGFYSPFWRQIADDPTLRTMLETASRNPRYIATLARGRF